MDRRHEQKFFQGRLTDGKQGHDKSAQHCESSENANKSHNEISPHTCQNDSHQKVYK